MFKTTTVDEIKAFMDKEPERYLDEREELADYEEDGGLEAYASEDCCLLALPGRRQLRFLAMPKQKDFDLAALENFVNKKTEHFILQLNLAEGQGRGLRFSEPYDTEGPILSLYADKADGRKAPKLPGKIRRLTPEDGRLVMGFRQKDASAMSLKQIFPLLVIDEIGTILAYFDEDGDLAGYASYMPTEFEAAAVDEIYVLPELRRQGIGTALAQALLELALEDCGACYWPVAESEAAVKTAEAAGFRKVAERMTLETF